VPDVRSRLGFFQLALTSGFLAAWSFVTTNGVAGEAMVEEPAPGSFYAQAGHGELMDDASAPPLLDLYGFIDFTYTKNLDGPDVPFDKFPGYGSFAVGNVNLYAASTLSKSLRSLVEVRFLYLPHGSDTSFGAGAVEQVDGTANDYADFERQLRWGGIELERVFLEYQPAPWLAVKMGQYLTPYGIWNIDHGTPTIIPVRRPFVIGENLFPERQTGIEANGLVNFGETSLGYHLTLSNGRGPFDAYRDLDENVALGGRVLLKNVSVGTLTLGASTYYGTYTDRDKAYGVKSGVTPAQLEVKDAITVQFEELVLGGDARFEWEGLLIQGELLCNQRLFVDAYRRVDTTGPAPDAFNFGGYALIGFRTPWAGVMPYTMFEHYNFSGSALFPPATGTTTGINVRPQANVVFKVQYQYSQMGTTRSVELLRGTQHQFDTQVAWAF
jgi:hypothetical protein